MIETLQILQVILFSIPPIALLVVGIMILSRSVSIIDQRIFLAAFIPLLLANTLAILEGDGLRLDWRAWLILAADLVLITGAVWVLRGYQVYGLKAETVETVVTEAFQQQGFTIETHSEEKRDLWGRARDACLLTAENEDGRHQVWITSRFNEVFIRTEQRTSGKILRSILPALQGDTVPYEFKSHAVGILYIVLAIVFALLTWIFFFEPRFILIE
ncbi:MAG: hypothetical protein K0B06_02270 [Brevefilum sp.]|nr:hypothetical protein [Brevefilum sp.]